MNIEEYKKVSYYTYNVYCSYLQKKYGFSQHDYMSPSWNKTGKTSRTSEGLFVHHKLENRVIQLSNPLIAKNHPYEWQRSYNLVYCDYLEHLFLHMLICEEHLLRGNNTFLGMGGIVTFLIPELNDIFSGWKPQLQWQENCVNLIINDLDVYLTLLERYYHKCSNNIFFRIEHLFTSANEKYGLWSNNKNRELYEKIKKKLKI